MIRAPETLQQLPDAVDRFERLVPKEGLVADTDEFPDMVRDAGRP